MLVVKEYLFPFLTIIICFDRQNKDFWAFLQKITPKKSAHPQCNNLSITDDINQLEKRKEPRDY